MPLTFNRIADALRTEDVEGLIASGAPADEYDSEARDTLAALSQHTNPTESTILAALTLVWTRTFHYSDAELRQRLPALQDVAQQLIRP